MQMQVSLDELLSMMMAQIDSANMRLENIRSNFNILGRAMHRKGLLTDDDIRAAVKEEYDLMKNVGLIEELPPQEMIDAMSQTMLDWIKGDAEGIKKSMEEQQKRMQDAMKKSNQKPKIDVAPSSVLTQLDRAAGKGKPKSKLIY